MPESGTWREEVVRDVTGALVARYRAELTTYAALTDASMREDIEFSIGWHTRTVLGTEPGSHRPGESIFFNSTTRRFDQGVPMEELLGSYDLWGEELWRGLSDRARDAHWSPGHLLATAAAVARHIEAARTGVQRTYAALAASGHACGSSGLRSDQVRKLVTTDEDSDNARFLAAYLRLDLASPHALVLVRPRRELAAPVLARAVGEVADAVTTHRIDLRVAGSDRDDAVLLCAVPDPEAERALVQATEIAATRVPDGVIAVSGARRTRGGFARSYREARDAISVTPVIGSARVFRRSDALVNRMLRADPAAEDLWADTVGPILEYDEQNSSNLLHSLQCYVSADLHLATAATHLHVHPNTVRYRLHRIRDVSGHNPLTTAGLLLLMSGLRLIEPDEGAPAPP